MRSVTSLARKTVMCGIIVVGVCCSLASSIRAEIDLWPFLEISDQTKNVCYPVYYQEGDFLQVLNLYVRTNHGRDHHVFWPFIKYSDGRLVRVAPFWFSQAENDYIFIPFIWQDETSTIWTIPPVYLKNNEEFSAVIPFYIRNKDDLFIFPDLFLSDNPQRQKTMVFPFFMNTESKTVEVNNTFWLMPYYHTYSEDGAYDFRALYPLLVDKKDGDAQTTWCFNYYSKHNQLSRQKLFFPFYYHNLSSDNDSRFLQILSYFSKATQSKDERSWGLLPFMVYDRTGDARDFWCMNAFYHDSPDSSGLMVLPFYNHTNAKTENGINNFYLFPFIHDWAVDGTRSDYVVPFLFESNRRWERVAGESVLSRQSLTVLNCSYSDDERETRQTVFPLYHYEENKVKEKKSLWLMPFFREWDENGTFDKQFFLPFYASQTNGDSSYFWTFNYYHSRTDRKSSLAVFPFYGCSEEAKDGSETEESMWILWPFYQRKKRIAADGELLTRNNRFLCFSSELDRQGKRTFSVFGKVITERMN